MREETGVWRLLVTGWNHASLNMAIDESILQTCAERKAPNTIRFYQWRPEAVSIGYFQSLEREVDLEFCREHGIDVVRRITGGGAVFHGSGEVTYSLIALEGTPGIPRNILRSYEVICQGLVEGLKMVGLQAVFNPVNDVLVNGRKISGSAQTRRWGAVLQHGTVLLDFEPSKMFSALRVTDEKIRDKMIRKAEERVTTIKKETGKKLTSEDVIEKLVEGFEKALDITLEPGGLTPLEKARAAELEKTKYGSKAWNYLR
ncbi:MAG: lipoate--protein ligase family protein [Methanobacteriota archaeon]|nr:MAG: lipoate--protein ligase family protein [Euryarchaeota archaeon]